MIKLLKYLKKSAVYILFIVLLLFLQAYCDLSLPDYTSRIVNVGIQQQGIEDGVPDKIRVSSMEDLFLFISEEDQETVRAAYEEEGDVLELQKISEEKRDELNQILGAPMLIVQQLSQDNEQTQAIRERMNISNNVDLLDVVAQIPQESRQELFGEIQDQNLSDA